MAEDKDNKVTADYDKVFVMPEEYHGVRPDQPREVVREKIITKTKIVRKKSRALPMVVIFALFITVSLLSYIGYLTYFKPAPEPEVIVKVVEPEPVVVEPEPEPEPVVVPSQEFDPAKIEPIKLSEMFDVDVDDDGLTDAEEFLLETDYQRPDSDQDSYLDGVELENLYNPIGSDPARLEFSGLVSTYVNPTFDYDLFYPKGWFARSVDPKNSEIVFSSPMNENVSVLVLENTAQLTLAEWYSVQIDEAEANIVEFENHNNMKGVRSPDEFTVYFARGEYIYVIDYDIGLKEKASYPHLFELLVQSFVFTGQE